jgi:soluble lytic murein transglycosylase
VKRTEEAPALNSACLYNLGRYKDLVKLFPASPAVPGISDVSGAWSKALSLFAEWKDPGSKEDSERAGREISSFLFGQIPAEVLRWAHSEALSLDGLLDPAELAALSGRLNPEDYGTSLRNFRSAISQDENVFFRYPQLIAELGRAYQYTPLFREEGASLFKSWAARASSVDAPGLYYLLFYSGRILRSLARYSESGEYFRRARALAPDALQSDTCVWYMLMNTMAENPRNTAAAVTATMPFWKDMSYFTDVLERLSAYLAAERQWNTMLEIFSAMENQGGQSLSQYAWILGRAAQEGYITTGRGAEDFFRIAFREAKGSFYYRAMAASKLGETFAPELQLSGEPDAALKAETEFILGLIEYAAPFARQYIRAAEDGLGAGELRQIAQALASAGEIRESLNIISRYTAREGYEPNYRDLELFYPRPFVDLTEKYAREAGIGPEILYGLIRTESYFEPEAVSRSGATGLAQLMPSTAEEMAGRIARLGGKDYRETLDLKDPETSVHIGSFYLGYLIRNMGSPMLALLSYNGGMGRVRRWLGQAPGGLPHDLFLETIEFGETREYGRRVLAAAAAYGYLYYGMSMEAVAEDIYRSSAP